MSLIDFSIFAPISSLGMCIVVICLPWWFLVILYMDVCSFLALHRFQLQQKSGILLDRNGLMKLHFPWSVVDISFILQIRSCSFRTTFLVIQIMIAAFSWRDQMEVGRAHILNLYVVISSKKKVSSFRFISKYENGSPLFLLFFKLDDQTWSLDVRF